MASRCSQPVVVTRETSSSWEFVRLALDGREPHDSAQRQAGSHGIAASGTHDGVPGASEGWTTNQRTGRGMVAGRQRQEQCVQAIAHPRRLLDELLAGIDEQLEIGIKQGRGHRGQVWLTQGNACHRDGIDLIVLTAATTAATALPSQA